MKTKRAGIAAVVLVVVAVGVIIAWRKAGSDRTAATPGALTESEGRAGAAARDRLAKRDGRSRRAELGREHRPDVSDERECRRTVSR